MSYAVYCRKHWAEYVKDRASDYDARARKKLIRAGISQCKTALANVFRGIGPKEMNGFTAAEIVRRTEI